MALAGAYTAVADDAAALYYNPAGLARVDGNFASVAFFLGGPNFSATGPTGVAELDPPSEQGYGLHFAWSPNDILDGDLGLGFSVLLPHRRALAFTVHAFEEPYFLLYENSIELLEIRLGVAYEFFDLFSIGASALLLGGLNGNVKLDAPFQRRAGSDPVDESLRTTLTMETVLPNREFFSVGLQFYPTDELTFSLAYREATFVPIEIPLEFKLQLLGLDVATVANVDVKPKYSPATLTAGAAYQPFKELLLSFDLVFAQYTTYELPFGDVSLANTADPSIVLLPPRRPKLSLRNVWIPRLGAEWVPEEHFTLRGGYYYFRSFIRSVDAPILESDKHGLSAGIDYDIGHHFLDGDAHKLSVQAAMQLVLFAGGTTAGYDYSGQIFATTFGSEFHY
jgi:long-subunit fatty acid transport protein